MAVSTIAAPNEQKSTSQMNVSPVFANAAAMRPCGAIEMRPMVIATAPAIASASSQLRRVR